MPNTDGSKRYEQHPPLASDEREELEWLRVNTALLRTERDILLRLATEFAQDSGLLWSPAKAIPLTCTGNSHNEDTPMNNTHDRQVWLTQDAREQLRKELATLRGEDGTDTYDRDSVESSEPSGEYLADKHRRHARIQQIQDLLNHAVVGTAPPDDGIAEPGMVLTVRFDDDDDTETFLLGTRGAETSDDIEVYSPDSPLGAALSGTREGDTKSYTVPSGETIRVTLVRAMPYGRHGHP